MAMIKKSGPPPPSWWRRSSFYRLTLLPFLWAVMLLPAPLPASDSPWVAIDDDGPVNCGNCHGWRRPVPEPRLLKKPHQALESGHGDSPLWCLDCHLEKNPARLRASRGRAVPFSDASRSCAVCHAKQVDSWNQGLHGKRLGSWDGPRLVAPCSRCHDPHRPTIGAETPSPPPSRSVDRSPHG